MAEVAYGSLPFREQSAFFRRKLNLPTTGWTDVLGREHDWAFVVAGANRDALVADFRAAVQKVIDEGATLQEFQRDFDRIVATHGWDHEGGRDWRSRIIYDTNLKSSYAAGRWQQMQAGKADRPFWLYRHADWVQQARPQHLAWDGLVLPADDPWWEAHYPPNGWGCQCSVRALNLRDLVRLGKSGPDTAPPVVLVEREIGQRSPMGPRVVRVPQGIDPGFDHTPGRSRLDDAMLVQRAEPLAPAGAEAGLPSRRPPGPLPEPQPLPAALPADGTLPRILAEFGATPEQPAVWRDVIGERLVIGRQSFASIDATTPWVAQALRSPDEIWVRIEWRPDTRQAAVRRRYLARFAAEGQAPELVVVELGPDGWSAVTQLQRMEGDADDWRIGVRLYRREDGTDSGSAD